MQVCSWLTGILFMVMTTAALLISRLLFTVEDEQIAKQLPRWLIITMGRCDHRHLRKRQLMSWWISWPPRANEVGKYCCCKRLNDQGMTTVSLPKHLLTSIALDGDEGSELAVRVTWRNERWANQTWVLLRMANSPSRSVKQNRL